MPTVLRQGPYRFHFYSKENNEPPHIHVARDDCEAKFWLRPVRLSRNYGLSIHEISKILGILEKKKEFLIHEWEKYHDRA